MTPAQLARTVVGAVRRAVADGELRVAVPEPGDLTVERARGPGRGDFATGLALRLAGPAGRTPRDVAGLLADRLAAEPGIARVEVAGPGFLNITLAPDAYADLIRTIRAEGERYGHGTELSGEPAAVPGPAGSVAHPARAAATARIRRARGATGPVPEAGAGDPALGADATAWAYVRPPAGDRPVTDPAVHLAQREANPLFRIRAAHARVRALLRNADDLGFGPQEGGCPHPAEAGLAALAAEHPRILAAAARDRAPDRLARALEGVADAFWDFHDACPVLPRGDEKPSAAHRSRLALADAAGTVLAGGLTLLGISAPEHL